MFLFLRDSVRLQALKENIGTNLADRVLEYKSVALLNQISGGSCVFEFIPNFLGTIAIESWLSFYSHLCFPTS